MTKPQNKRILIPKKQIVYKTVIYSVLNLRFCILKKCQQLDMLIKKEWRFINMKKLAGKLTAWSLAIVMLSSVASAEMSVGQVEYISDKIKVSTPYAGELESCVKVKNEGSEPLSAQLITGLYDKETGKLMGVTMSDPETSSHGKEETLVSKMNVDTLNGYILKNFVWDGLSQIVPYDRPYEKSIILSAENQNNYVTLSWQIPPHLSSGSVAVMKNNKIIANNLSAENLLYVDKSGIDKSAVYKICVFDNVGVLIADSNEVTVAEQLFSYSFDSKNMNPVANDKVTYGAADKMLSIVGANPENELTYDEETKKWTTSLSSDSCWVKRTIGERPAAYTTAYTRPSSVCTTGKIPLEVGESYTPDDKGITITFDYYDFGHTGGKLWIRYITGYDESNNKATNTKTAEISYGETAGWKTATLELTGAVFNGNFKTGFRENISDLRFEHNVAAKEIAIGGFTIEKINRASVTFGDGVQYSKSLSAYTDNNFDNNQGTQDSVMRFVKAGSDNAYAISTTSFLGGNSQRVTMLYFNVDDEYMYGNSDCGAEIEITYLSNSEKNIALRYMNVNGAAATVKLKMAGNTGNWEKAIFNLSDVSLSNGINNNDFRLYIDGLRETDVDEDENVIQLIIKEVCVRNVTPKEKTPTIYLVGDSTCETLNSNWQPREGWGMEIGGFFKNVNIVNNAKGGKSTRSFLNNMDVAGGGATADTRWSDILDNAKMGDYLFVQFGHNERSADEGITDELQMRHTDPTSEEFNAASYRWNLKRFITAAREKGMIPVLITSIWPRDFGADGKLSDKTIEPYREAMRDIGGKYGVAVLDVGAEHKLLVEKWGEESSKALYAWVDRAEYPEFPANANAEDNIHMSKIGAIEVSKIIIKEIQKGASDNKELRELSKYINTDADTEFLLPPTASEE